MLAAFAEDEFPNNMTAADFIPGDVKSSIPDSVYESMKNVKSRSDLKDQISLLKGVISSMESSIGILQSYMPAMSDLPEGQTLMDIMSEEDYNSLAPAAKGQVASITTAEGLENLIGGLNGALSSQKSTLTQMNDMDKSFAQLAKGKIPEGMSLLDFIPADVKSKLSKKSKETMASIHSISDIDKELKKMDKSIADMNRSIEEMRASQAEMQEAMNEMKESADNLEDLKAKLEVLRDAVPGAFDKAEENYLISIDERSDAIEKIFQRTLNEGFKNIYLLVVIASILAILLLLGYSTKLEKERNV